ncbi:hypothetical protein KY338_05660 [Candidatus Woesearchaeota archaeon]|nr:hypothetical protein [Candidatus Woesearchaeota archaeon]
MKKNKPAIAEIIKKIWKAPANQYKTAQEHFAKMPIAELIDWCSDTALMGFYSYGYPRGSNLNLFTTAGCPHKFEEDNEEQTLTGGCSMCNYHSEFLTPTAAMSVLRKRDPTAYLEIMKQSFVKERGVSPKPNLVELISGNDMFSEQEFPEKSINILFQEKDGRGLFSVDPREGYVFEARADSIVQNRRRLEQFRKIFGNVPVEMEIGVEVGDGKNGIYDFLRNNWINKNVSSEDIEKAIKLCQEYGFKIQTNVLVGIPGLTEDQARQAATTTVKWLASQKPDTILLLPLNHKKFTLQDVVRNLKDDELKRIGLSYGRHTGTTWFYTLARAIGDLKSYPEIKERLNLAQISSNTNSIENSPVYNARPDCGCTAKAVKLLSPSLTAINYDAFESLGEDFGCAGCYEQYSALLKRQALAGPIPDTLRILFSRISQRLFPDETAQVLNQKFNKELQATENGK